MVAEQGDGPGGYAHAFKRGPYTFDPAIHATWQAHDWALPAAVYRHLGIADRLNFIQSDAFYGAAFPDFRFRAPSGFDEFVEAHVEAFPSEADGIRSLFELCAQVQREAHEQRPQLSLRELDELKRQAPTLFKYSRATAGEVLDECLSDTRAKAVCSALWPYAGVPPSRLSFVLFSQIVRVCVDGSFYCEGSFQALVDALVGALEANGGELVLRQRVSRISVEDGAVTGIELDGGARIRASVVISNADARRTFEEMVGSGQLPSGFMKRLARMRPSLSGFVLFTATTTDPGALDLEHETLSYASYAHEETYQGILDGRPGGMWVSFPTMADPSLAPPGEHLAIFSSLAPYDIGRPWAEAEEQHTDQILDHFEMLIPGLRDSLTFLESATPHTLERFTLNQKGAAYGWENNAAQVGSKRSPRKAPVEGLWLTGHWTQPGSTSLRVLVSGVHTAQAVLREVWGERLGIEHPELPPV